MTESIDDVVAFVLELDKLKGVERKTQLLGLARYESSAEHSWQIAMLAASLASFAGLVDMSRVIAMLLVHDIGEIDTGDTIVFAEGGWEERKAAERRAVERIFAILPAPRASEFLALWTEFEENGTAEARFANAVDRAMPVLLNLSNNGQSWRENGISYDRVVAKVRPPVEAGCPALWCYLERRLADARGEGLFGAP